MSRLLYRVGGATAAHPWRTIAAWLVVLVAAFGLASTFGGSPHDDYNVPGTSSQRGTDLLRDKFPAMSGTDARVVVHSEKGAIDERELTALNGRLTRLDHVTTVDPVRMSADGDTALFTVHYDIPVTDFEGATGVDALKDAVAPTEDAGLRAELGGQVPENIGTISGVAEFIGIAVALVILLFAFGSVVAAGLPLAVAFVGLGVGSAGITLLAAATDISTQAPTVASMVGIGVGIDYALLLAVRHVEGLRDGLDPVRAAAHATATAGQSVLFAGATVLLSLFGLSFSGLAVFASFGYATALTVAFVVLTALTLVPALCALAGRRMIGRRARTASTKTPLTARWATTVGRRPLPWLLGALAVLLLLAAPVLSMRMWPQDAGSQPTTNTVRQAYDLTADEYGPGANGPLVIAVDLDRVSAGRLDTLRREITSTDGVAGVGPTVTAPTGDAAVFSVEPSYGPQDERAAALVERLRADVLPDGADITGLTAVFVDINDITASRLWLVIGIVVAMSFVLLVIVFRSIVVPIKAAIVNLLSIGAAYGVMVAVFQWGWAAGLVGLDHPVDVSTWVPILMFAILFGLSMDYEVFLLSRIREDWLATGDAHGSVVRGLASTGRVISSAAAIMVAVFVGFGLDTDVTVKMIGVGMAVAVFVDATIVRMILVPATMQLLGSANWWLPGWLDRILPTIDLHATEPTPPAKELVDA